jgi:enediyne biosynthesis protein E4
MATLSLPPEQTGRKAEVLPRGAISPLAPVLVPLAVAAIALAVVFSLLFPAGAGPAKAPAVRFENVTGPAGISHVHDSGTEALGEAPTTLPGAVAWVDADGDGLPDLLLAGGVAWPWTPEGKASRFAFYHNLGGGRFRDATRDSGLDFAMPSMAIAVGDYDNDGRPDLYLTGIGGNRLMHNVGGRYEDVTVRAGVAGDSHVWSTGAVWIDITGSGRLDLVVCNYARWSSQQDLQSALASETAGFSYMNPGGFVSVFPTVYRNLGNGRFADVSASTGLDVLDRQSGHPRGYPLAVAAVDLDGDGRMDLLFTYQSGEDALFLNQGDGTFKPWTPPQGQRSGGSAGLVGVGIPGLARGRYAERFAVLRSAGLVLAQPDEGAQACRLRYHLGGALADLGLTGDLGIISGEGLAEPALARFEAGRAFGSRPEVLWGSAGAWAPLAVPAGPADLGAPLVARGVAVADAEDNGSLYVAVAQNGGPALLYKAQRRGSASWLRVDLVGTRCARDGWGARVEVHTPRSILVQTLEPAVGFMAQSEKTLTFGLGDDDRIRRVVVRWPDGTRQEVRGVEANHRVVIREP